MAKDEVAHYDFADFLSEGHSVVTYDLSDDFDFDGKLFVKNTSAKRPKWSEIVDSITGVEVVEIANKSSSAVLFLRVDGKLFAFTFGYGRYLIDTAYFVQDFGLKTALNTLNHESLRSVDIHTLDDQPVQKKSQAVRESDASVFGIDISKDVLRAVTGSPKPGINFKNISGGDALYSFGLKLYLSELPALATRVAGYYDNEDYKSGFGWVDNVRRIKEKSLIASLDEKLLQAIKGPEPSIIITLPEIEKWDSILGFSFTRSKKELSPTIQSSKYLSGIEDKDAVTIESIKRDRLFITDIHGNEFSHSIYKCVYFESSDAQKTNLIFGGTWYEIDNSFIGRIESVLDQIEISTLPFPPIETWEEDDKTKIETEGDYNERAAQLNGYHLLDKKLIKSNRTTTSIELCDLLSPEGHFIHAKHRKGGSAGLSHLFAQGSVSAEILLGDKEFRKAARKVLNRISTSARDLVPLNSPKSSDFEIVFLILGDDSATVKSNLPFFSKVNLSRSYESLSQRGFAVSISGASKIQRQ
jgi:uncharacterized protein (TIGR04141 family)